MQATPNKGLPSVVTDKYKHLNEYVLDIKKHTGQTGSHIGK